MSVETQPETGGGAVRRAVGVVAGSFSVIVLLAAVAYAAMVNVVDWVTVDVLAYPVGGVAPFVVITGAILTIPIVVPTVLVTVKLLR
ncbi:hypothetical protein [Salinigranum halophilum]|jgi:hypothetical protein|uniref:hypothetical protein n=1 Tax=Salinigranum halophilum TaxID=2565931 RepID=UPI00115E24F6|nr:hypothetical protein [Salinigranum halophilum]